MRCHFELNRTDAKHCELETFSVDVDGGAVLKLGRQRTLVDGTGPNESLQFCLLIGEIVAGCADQNSVHIITTRNSDIDCKKNYYCRTAVAMISLD